MEISLSAFSINKPICEKKRERERKEKEVGRERDRGGKVSLYYCVYISLYL